MSVIAKTCFGWTADRIAKSDPLLPRLRVFQELYDVTQPPPVPGCQPFSNERLIKLAAAMSSEAAVSSRQELYPHNMDALRALKLGIGALSGLGLGEKNEGFTIWQVHNRVSSRYPEAMKTSSRHAYFGFNAVSFFKKNPSSSLCELPIRPSDYGGRQIVVSQNHPIWKEVSNEVRRYSATQDQSPLPQAVKPLPA